MAKNAYEAILEMDKKIELSRKQMDKLKESTEDFGSAEIKRLKNYGGFVDKINANIEKALKTRAVSEGKALKEVSERITNNHLDMMKQIKEREKATQIADEAERKRAVQTHDQKLKDLHKTYSQEKKNAQQVMDGITKYGKAIDDMNSRVRGTVFDPTIGLFGGGAKLKDTEKNIEFVETRLVSVADTVGDAFNGNIDSIQSRFDKLGRGTGQFLKDMRTSAKMKFGPKAEGKGPGAGGAKAIMGVTTLMGGLGTALLGVTAVLGGMFAIFKIAQGIEEAIKGVNKELLDAYGAADLVGIGFEEKLGDNIEKIRKGLGESSFANQLGVSLEQARQLTMSFNEIGINFQTLSEDGKVGYESIEQMKDATIAFQASAKTLGVDFSALVGFGKEFTQELGVSVAHGAGLERMTKEFGRIRDLAKQSSLNTKDFFGVIQDLSQGIGTMNLRIGEAANLFVNLSKVMGPQAAQAFTKALAGGFKGEGIQDRFKRIILTGGMQKVLKRTAQRTKDDFFAIYKSGKMKGLLKEAGVDKSRDLSKMSDADLEKAMGVLRRKGGSEGEGAARQLMKSVRLARGGEGGLSAQALALGDLDMTGTMSAQMQQLYNVTGGKGFRDVSAIEMEKISQMTGKSIEDLEGMRQIDMAMRDDFRVIQQIKKDNTDKGGDRDAKKIAKALKDAGLTDLTVDKKGAIRDKSGREIKDIQSYIASQGASLNKVETNSFDQLTLLQEVADATLTSATMISNKIDAMKMQLSNPLEFMADIMGVKDKSRGKRRQVADKLQGTIGDQELELEAERERYQEEDRKERRRISGIKDFKKRQEAQEKLKEKKETDQASLVTKQKEIDFNKQKVKMLMGAEGRKIQGTDLKDLESQAEARVERQMSRSKSGRAELTDEQAIAAQVLNALELGGVDTKNMRATKENVLKLLSGNEKGIGEEDDVISKEELEKRYKITADAGFGGLVGKVSGKGHDLGGVSGAILNTIAEGFKFVPVIGASTGGEDSRSTKSKFKFKDKEGRTLSGYTDEGYEEGASALGGLLKVKKNRGYRTVASKVGVEKGSEKEKERDKKAIKLGIVAEKQLSALEKLEGPPSDQEQKKMEELRGKVEAKNKVLQDANKKTMVDAYLESDRQKLRNQVMREFGGTEEKFETEKGRKSYIKDIDTRLSNSPDMKTEFPEKYNELLQMKRNFKSYYAQAEDAALTPGGGTPFIGNAGSLIQGTDTDTAMLVDFTKAKGGGGTGNVVFNVNGNNEQAMISSIESYMRSIGFIS